MKPVLIMCMVLLLTAGVYISGPEILFASDDNEVENEMSGVDGEEGENYSDEKTVDMNDYLRVLNEEREDEAEFEDQRDDQYDEERPDEAEFEDKSDYQNYEERPDVEELEEHSDDQNHEEYPDEKDLDERG